MLSFPMSLPIILSSGSKGERWRLCLFDSSRSPYSSSKLSLGNPWREIERGWGLQSFSWDDGGVRKHDDSVEVEAPKHGVKRPNWWSPGDSGDIKTLGSSDGLYLFLWFLSVWSMATISACVLLRSTSSFDVYWTSERRETFLSQPPNSNQPITARDFTDDEGPRIPAKTAENVLL